MTDFAETFTALSEKHEGGKVNYAKMARHTGIEVSLLHRLHTGERKPTNLGQVDAIANYLCLSRGEREQLTEAFYVTVEGEYQYYGRKALAEFLRTLNPDIVQTPALVGTFYLDHMDQPLQPISGKMHVGLIIREMLSLAAEQEDGEALLCQPLVDEFLLDILYEVAQSNKNVPVRHVFVADNSRHVSTEHQLYNIELLRLILPMMMKLRNYHTFITYDSVDLSRSASYLAQNFLVVGDRVLLFSSDYNTATLITEPRIAAQYRAQFEQLEKDASPFASWLDADTGLQSVVGMWQTTFADASESMPAYFFDAGIQLEQILTANEKVSDAHMTSNVNALPAFQESYRKYLMAYRQLFEQNQSKVYEMFTKQAVDKLVDEGRPNKLHPKDVTPLNLVERLGMMKIWLTVVIQKELPMLDMPETPHYPFSLMSTPHHLLFCMYGEGGNLLLSTITEQTIVQLFYYYMDYEFHHNQVPRENTIRYLRDKVRELELKIEAEGITSFDPPRI